MGLEILIDGKVIIDGKEKKPTLNTNGYYMIWYNNKLHYIHRLVANSFIPNPENKPLVNHINGIKTDNNISNLEWTTYKENNNHAQENKLWGENIIKKRKLTDEQVKEIREKYIPRKYSMKKLANEYGVGYRTINDIINNRSYMKRKEDYLVVRL